MSEIEKMRQYINKNRALGQTFHGYEIRSKELVALINELPPIDAVLWAFTYGRAKGYRAAKAEVRRG